MSRKVKGYDHRRTGLERKTACSRNAAHRSPSLRRGEECRDKHIQNVWSNISKQMRRQTTHCTHNPNNRTHNKHAQTCMYTHNSKRAPTAHNKPRTLSHKTHTPATAASAPLPIRLFHWAVRRGVCVAGPGDGCPFSSAPELPVHLYTTQPLLTKTARKTTPKNWRTLPPVRI